jgi:hypothetical protein
VSLARGAARGGSQLGLGAAGEVQMALQSVDEAHHPGRLPALRGSRQHQRALGAYRLAQLQRGQPEPTDRGR